MVDDRKDIEFPALHVLLKSAHIRRQRVAAFDQSVSVAIAAPRRDRLPIRSRGRPARTPRCSRSDPTRTQASRKPPSRPCNSRSIARLIASDRNRLEPGPARPDTGRVAYRRDLRIQTVPEFPGCFRGHQSFDESPFQNLEAPKDGHDAALPSEPNSIAELVIRHPKVSPWARAAEERNNLRRPDNPAAGFAYSAMRRSSTLFR